MSKKEKWICLCNQVSEPVIRKAIEEGANKIDELFDRTTAGVGACGGSCRPQLKKLLERYAKPQESSGNK